jgi:Protein of unknown function (DUF3822)
MKTLFEILPEKFEPEAYTLICDVSQDTFAFALKNEEQKRFEGVAIYQFQHDLQLKDQGKNLGNILHKHSILEGSFKRVITLYSYPECVLMPFELYHSQENKNVLKLIYGDMDMHTAVLTDIITDQRMYSIYRVPATVMNMFQTQYGDCKNQHLYTVLLKQFLPKEDKMLVFFFPGNIIVKLNKGGKTGLINSYQYSTPTDIAYMLLNICRQAQVENIPLEIGGLIEKDSVLFKELYKYFHDIYFTALPEANQYSEAISRQHTHYFSPIFAVNTCES